MKRCAKCDAEYADEYDGCPVCAHAAFGDPQELRRMRHQMWLGPRLGAILILAAMAVIVLFVLVAAFVR